MRNMAIHTRYKKNRSNTPSAKKTDLNINIKTDREATKEEERQNAIYLTVEDGQSRQQIHQSLEQTN